MLRVMLTVFFVAVLTTAAQAQYTFMSVEAPFPDVTTIAVAGLTTDGTLLGIYNDANGNQSSYLLTKRGTLTPMPMLSPQAISPDGQWLVGNANRPLNPYKGFLFHAGTVRWLYPPTDPYGPEPGYVEASGVSPTGVVVGDYRDGFAPRVIHGLIYDIATKVYTTVNAPFATHTSLVDRNSAGVMVGTYSGEGPENRPHGSFLLDGSTYTRLQVPSDQEESTFATGINDAGMVVGIYGWIVANAFTYSPRAGYTAFGVPGALSTLPMGITQAGVIFGQYIDAAQVPHGFLATPNPGRHAPPATGHGQDLGGLAAVICQGPSKHPRCRQP